MDDVTPVLPWGENLALLYCEESMRSKNPPPLQQLKNVVLYKHICYSGAHDFEYFAWGYVHLCLFSRQRVEGGNKGET